MLAVALQRGYHAARTRVIAEIALSQSEGG